MTGWNRCKIALAGGVLAATVGCNTTPKQPAMPAAPSPLTSAPSSSSSKTVFVPEPADDPKVEKKGPLAPSTLLVFADTWVEAVRNDPAKAPPERERLLTQARQFYNEVLARDPKNLDALLGLGKMYQVTGEYEKLAETEKRIRDVHPNNAKAWAWIAVRQAQSKEWDNSADSFHKAVKLDPDNREYRIKLGFTLARGGRYEEGYAWLSRSKRESEARYNLAMMMIHNNKPDLARQQLEFALQVEPNFKQATEQLAMLNSGEPAQDTPAPKVETTVRTAKPENIIRTVNYEEPPPAPAPTPATRPMPLRPLEPQPIPTAPQGLPPEPLPVGISQNSSPRGPLPPAYTATTGWDTTIPPRR
ncbi:tetratricopeptide repeat protein [Zavarzinella formosa]|uniref:tetratricopeptide repeat protein n=1 Tax=Zavarzinella formosa TaxID=360055 RepID=UPI000317D33D|nr:tetratricopeptide repeat protein [Zavarzinella formosa]